jgi:hypothetical protein
MQLGGWTHSRFGNGEEIIMTRWLGSALLTVAAVGLGVRSAQAQATSRVIPFIGVSTSLPASSTQDVTVQLWDAPVGGTLLFSEAQPGLAVDAIDTKKHTLGVIAEEVGQVLPEIVDYEDNGKDARGLDYARLTAVLIEAVKEQQARIRTLTSEIEDLRSTKGTRERAGAGPNQSPLPTRTNPAQ